MCVVGFESKDGDFILIKGYCVVCFMLLIVVVIEQESVFVEFCIGYDVMFWLIRIMQVEYFVSCVVVVLFVSVVNVCVEVGLCIWFEVIGGVVLFDILLELLLIYFVGLEVLFVEFYCQMIGEMLVVIVWLVDVVVGLDGWKKLFLFWQFGFDDDQVLLFVELCLFCGYCLFSEYFVCFECFLFVDLLELVWVFCDSLKVCDVVLLFD